MEKSLKDVKGTILAFTCVTSAREVVERLWVSSPSSHLPGAKGGWIRMVIFRLCLVEPQGFLTRAVGGRGGEDMSGVSWL